VMRFVEAVNVPAPRERPRSHVCHSLPSFETSRGRAVRMWRSLAGNFDRTGPGPGPGGRSFLTGVL
jgi:hypothetical protein